MQDNRKKSHPTELQIALHHFGFFQNFANAHDLTFTAAERVLSKLFVHREKGLFLSVYVDDIKLAGKN